MDAIKKKMQAMKLEKDNAMDRADACEQQAKDANLRAERVSHFTYVIFCQIRAMAILVVEFQSWGYSIIIFRKSLLLTISSNDFNKTSIWQYFCVE